MLDTIGLCLASRNRPTRFRDMYTSALSTADEPDKVFFSLRVDNDEPQMGEYKALLRKSDRLESGERGGLCGMVNESYSNIAGKYDMYCPVSDDLIFRTPHWDSIVKNELNAMPCPIGLVWGDGGTGRPKTQVDRTSTKWANSTALPTWFFVTKDWISATGYFLPSQFYKDYADTWYVHLISYLEEHGHGCQVPYLEDKIMIEHMHPSFGKAAMDTTYTETIRRYADTGICNQDSALFKRTYGQREEDGAKLLQKIVEFICKGKE